MARRITVKAKAPRADSAADSAAGAKAADLLDAPSPNPMTNLILTDLLLRGGGQIMRHAVEAALLSNKYDKSKARKIIKGRSLTQTLVTTAVARIATRSVPGAILVGGVTVAKLLYDRGRDKRAALIDGQKAVAEQASKGAKK